MEAVRYGVGSWKADGLGNHRAVVRVGEKAEAVRVRIPWRRRDREPEKKDVIVIDAATGERVENVVRVEVGRAYGEIVFQPRSGPGEYYVYFMPFGLSGEMLQRGGNLWRGMLYYGMTNRLGWNRESRPEGIWRFWDECGIAEMAMFGYWDGYCPVRTGREDVLATAYVGEGRTVVSLASWAKGEVDCALAVDWERLGIGREGAEWRAPGIEGFQEERVFGRGERIPVAPGKGWLLVVEVGEGRGGMSGMSGVSG